MALTPEFRTALERLALACAAYEAATGLQAVLVGGGCATLYTTGAFASGDFDLVGPRPASEILTPQPAAPCQRHPRAPADLAYDARIKAGESWRTNRTSTSL